MTWIFLYYFEQSQAKEFSIPLYVEPWGIQRGIVKMPYTYKNIDTRLLGKVIQLHYHPQNLTIICISVLFCSVLFCSVLFCSVLFCSVPFCSVLFCSVLFCSVLLCSVLFCSVLFCSVLFCSVYNEGNHGNFPLVHVFNCVMFYER
jgi:hypothetical protein